MLRYFILKALQTTCIRTWPLSPLKPNVTSWFSFDSSPNNYLNLCDIAVSMFHHLRRILTYQQIQANVCSDSSLKTSEIINPLISDNISQMLSLLKMWFISVRYRLEPNWFTHLYFSEYYLTRSSREIFLETIMKTFDYPKTDTEGQTIRISQPLLGYIEKFTYLNENLTSYLNPHKPT